MKQLNLKNNKLTELRDDGDLIFVGINKRSSARSMNENYGANSGGIMYISSFNSILEFPVAWKYAGVNFHGCGADTANDVSGVS